MGKNLCEFCHNKLPKNWDFRICPKCEKIKEDYNIEQMIIIQEMSK